MKHTHRVAGIAITFSALLLLAGCGQSPEEQAFVQALNDRGWPNPEGALVKGHQICDALSGLNPADRYTTEGIFVQRGYYYPVVKAASDHLCPAG